MLCKYMNLKKNFSKVKRNKSIKQILTNIEFFRHSKQKKKNDFLANVRNRYRNIILVKYKMYEKQI